MRFARYARSSFNAGVLLTVPLVGAEWALNGRTIVGFSDWLLLFALGGWVGLAILVARASLHQANSVHSRMSQVALACCVAVATIAAVMAAASVVDALGLALLGSATLVLLVLGSVAVVRWVLQGRELPG